MRLHAVEEEGAVGGHVPLLLIIGEERCNGCY